MKRTLKKLLTGFLILTSFFVSACATPTEPPAQTDTDNIQWNNTDEELVTTKGIATNITLSIGGGEGAVWAKVKNNFTLLPSTIWVYVELYSSETYQESYTTMKLEKTDSVKDLDMGNSITISVPTGGEQKYWQARMRYKFDNRDWVAKTTSTFLYSANGEVIDEPEQKPEPPKEKPQLPEAKGPFYDLYSAYDKGMLTQEQLLSIAYYHHRESYTYDLNTRYNTELMGENYQPIAKSPETLSEDTKLNIKKSLRDLVYTDNSKIINLDDIHIFAYYGTYNDGYAIRISYEENGNPYPANMVISDPTIGGVKFFYPHTYSFFSGNGYYIGYRILYWKLNDEPKIEEPNTEYMPTTEKISQTVENGPFYSLQWSYDNGWLTQEDLQSIANYRKVNSRERPILNEDIAQTIESEWAKKYNEEHNTEKTATIQEYYGTYNGCVAVVVDLTNAMYIALWAPIGFEIGGVTFIYGNTALPQIVIYKY